MEFGFDTVTGIGYTVLFAVVFLLAVRHGQKNGLLAGVFGLVGSLGGIWLANLLSGKVALWFYENVLGTSISEKIDAALQENSGDIGKAISTLDFLPQTLLDRLQDTVQAGMEDVPSQVVTALQPLLLPMIQVVVFVVVWAVIRFLVNLLSKAFRSVNLVPLLGTLNRTLGLCFGAVIGMLNCWILSMGLWAFANLSGGKIPFITLAALQDSGIYTLFAHFNPFLTYY